MLEKIFFYFLLRIISMDLKMQNASIDIYNVKIDPQQFAYRFYKTENIKRKIIVWTIIMPLQAKFIAKLE